MNITMTRKRTNTGKPVSSKGIVVWTAVATAILLASPLRGHAQVRAGVYVDWWEWIGDVRVHGSVDYGHVRRGVVYRDHGYVHPPVVYRYRRPVRVEPRARGDRGPAFCRSGRGHPVHGWNWCVRKGFVSRHFRRVTPVRPAPRRRPVACCVWSPVDLGPVRFHPDHHHRVARPLRHAEVVSILGRVVVDDLYVQVGYRRDVRLEARWHPSTGDARVLQVRADATPLAEFTDLDGDLRVDQVFLAGLTAEDR